MKLTKLLIFLFFLSSSLINATQQDPSQDSSLTDKEFDFLFEQMENLYKQAEERDKEFKMEMLFNVVSGRSRTKKPPR
jgi:hypothetical protein